MKKLIATLLTVLLLFSLVGCFNKYEPVESTEREKTVAMTFTINGSKYEMPYEMYRAFFLNHKDKVTGGDDTLLTGEKKLEYIERIDEIIIDLALDIFSTFELCKTVGIDVYSADFGKKINDYINESIESKESYDAYLASLKALNLNYSMQYTLFRYALALDALEKHYIGANSVEEIESGFWQGGALKYTDEDIRLFYDGEDCARILRLHLQGSAYVDPMARANELKERIEEAKTEREVANIMIGNSLTGGPELENGYLIGRYNLNALTYGPLINAAFSLEVGEVADPVVIHDGDEYVYYIVYRGEKSDEHFENNKDEVTYVYLWNELGKMLEGIEADLMESVVKSEFANALEYDKISMDEENDEA